MTEPDPAAAEQRPSVGRNLPTFQDLPIPADTANLREGPDLNAAMLALLPLVGVWRGEGEGRDTDGDYASVSRSSSRTTAATTSLGTHARGGWTPTGSSSS
ncbi:protein of uncharacterised function (DUF1794) [Mycobacteroides abscessus]|nr:protein of uncharacterised function (DUF1794) [Mycobacteroides abscessus]